MVCRSYKVLCKNCTDLLLYRDMHFKEMVDLGPSRWASSSFKLHRKKNWISLLAVWRLAALGTT